MNTFGLALTSALVDFVWQGTLVAVALLAGLHTLGRRSPQVRYGLSAVVLMALMATPIVTTVSRYEPAKPESSASMTAAPAVRFGSAQDQRVTEAGRPRDVAVLLRVIAPWVLPVWSLGVVLLSLRLVAGGVHVRQLRRSACSADAALRARVSHLASRMGIHRHIQLVTSTLAEGPGVIGWVRPLILLPPATAMGLTTAQLDAVLAHELAHIRRHDYLVNIIQMVAETLLFYHPAVWWVSKRLRVERELCCDDEAVRICGDATTYARALVMMAKMQVPALAMGSTGGSLSDRVRRLLGLSRHEPRRSAAFGVIAIAVALMSLTLAGVNAQKERVRFDVASVKPASPEGRGFGGVQFLPRGVVRADRTPLWALIATAYDVRWQQVEGESKLLDERFTIDARADASALPPEGATIEQTFRSMVPVLRDMLKTLLAERFKLVTHVERRDSPIYALVVGAKGHRLTPAAKDCAPTTAAELAQGAGPCGFQGGGPARGFRLRGSELSALAAGLSNFAGRTVVDRTGIPGRFDIDVPPWSSGAPPRPLDPGISEPQPDPNAPSLFTVLQEQLGLRLETARGPIDYYVIDHVERPDPN